MKTTHAKAYIRTAQKGSRICSCVNRERCYADCRAGKVNLILTKSISRFARNTVTLLETVRELKSLEVDIFFEEQNIHTMSAEGELMLTILASYAQEESLSASENQKWRVRKGFENGELVNWRFLFGYRIDKNTIEIDEKTAPIVGEIFDRVISGDTFGTISRDLNSRKIPNTLGGKWRAQRIRDIVSNEKYKGDALLQKKFTVDFLMKKMKTNEGEVPQYYVEHSHEAIIATEKFEAVQEAYVQEAERIESRYNLALEHYNALEIEKQKRNRKSKELQSFISILKNQPLINAEWNERLWITLLDTATVCSDGKIVFRFKNGKEIIW